MYRTKENIMNTKFFTLLYILLFTLVNVLPVKAQDCSNTRLETEIVGSACSPGGKVTITVTVVSDGEIDITNNRFILSKNGSVVSFSDFGSNVINNVPIGGPYSLGTNNVLCNGTKIPLTLEGINVAFSWKVDKAEYTRCNASDIVVKASASLGTGPYKYQVLDAGSVIAEATGYAVTIPTSATSDNLQLQVSDEGCAANTPIVKNLTKTVDLSTITTVVEGDKDVCTGEALNLSVKGIYTGSNYKWEKDGTILSTSRSLNIPVTTESNSGTYIFSMNFDGCSTLFTENIVVAVGKAAKPVVTPANACLNAGAFSLSSYVSATAPTYTVVWYNQGGTLIGETAPTFNPNNAGTFKYFVTQRTPTGCESDKEELTVTVHNPPTAIGANNVIFCNSPSSPDPKMIVINAGNYTYNLYDSYSGGNKIGSGTASGDTALITSSALVIGNNYYLETEDQYGCVSISRTTIKVTVKESLIVGATNLCFGSNLVLTADYPGGVITWTKPDNTTYTGRTLTINNIGINGSGVYKLEINEAGLGCTMYDQVTVLVTQPAKPQVADTFYRYYQNETPVRMTAVATHTLKWYDPSGNLMLTAGQPEQSPYPATNTLGAFVYHVAQDSAGCESPRVPVRVVIGEVPDAVDTSDINICITDKPLIQIANTIAGYKYSVYDAATLLAEGTGNGATLSLTSTLSVDANKLSVIVTDTFGIPSPKTDKAMVSANNIIASAVTQLCVGSQGALKAATISNASAYTWTNPAGTDIITPILTISNVTSADSGQYKLTVDMTGCPLPVIKTVDVSVWQPNTPVATTLYRFYQNEAAPGMTATAEAGHILTWYDPAGNMIVSDGQLVQTPVPATNNLGTFVYHVSQFLNGCESDKLAVTVIVGEVPDAVLPGDINLCIADKPLIQIANTIAGYKYSVYYQSTEIAQSTGNGGTISLNSNTSVTENTNLEVTVTDTFGITSSKTLKAYISANNIIDLVNSASQLCVGSQGNLAAVSISNASTYTWRTPAGSDITGQTITVTNATAADSGQYKLSVDMAGCPLPAVKYIDLNVSQPTTPTATTSYRFYQNESAAAMTATAEGGHTLNWYDPAGNLIVSGGQPVQAPVPATNNLGTFVYHVSQVLNGCESQKLAVTVIVGEVPDAVLPGDINLCIADKPLIQISNTIAGYTYSVYFQNNLIAQGTGNGATISINSTASVTENANLEITVTDTYGVTSPKTLKAYISVNNLIDTQNTSSSICEDSQGVLTAVSVSNASTYVWTNPAGTQLTGQSVTITAASSSDAGQYKLTVSMAGCPSDAAQTINLTVAKPANPVTTTDVYYCVDDNAAQLTATALPGYYLVWFDDSHNQLSGAPTPGTSVAGVTEYYVSQVSQTDANCTSDKEKITVTVEDKPNTITIDPVNVCAGKTILVPVQNSVAGYTYSLYSAETGGNLIGQVTGNGSTVNITVGEDIQSQAVYYLEVKNIAGCAATARAEVVINVVVLYLLPNELPPYQVEEYYSQRLETNASNPKFSVIQGYLPAGFTISSIGNIAGIASSYEEPSEFTIEVTNDMGCSIQKDFTLKSELLVAKMFSPNGDGINDVFMKGYKVTIFDRLGRKLFSGDNGWDGTYKGKVMPEDVYYYVLYYNDPETGAERKVTGYFTLIKTI